MKKDVLLDGIVRTAKNLAKYTKYYEKYMDRPVGPNDQYKAEQYMQLESIQQELLRNLKKYN